MLSKQKVTTMTNPINLYPASSLVRHEAFKDFDLPAQVWAFAGGKTPLTLAILDALLSVAGIHSLAGAVQAGPNRPPMPAIEGIVLHMVGVAAFSNENKQFMGRAIKTINETMGATLVGRGKPITVTSRFASGATYQFAAFVRRPMKREAN